MDPIARYKVLKDDFGYQTGSNLVLTPANAEADLVLGRLQLIEYLDPNDELDSAKIRHFYENPTGGGRPVSEDPTIEEAVKGITGKAFKRGNKPAAKAGTDDGADDGEANVSRDATAPVSASYDGMTVPELKEHARGREIDITGLSVRDDIVKAIKKQDKKDAA